MKKVILLIVLIFAIGINNAEATLIDRGGGLIYDTDLNITWLQDANYADTTGYDDILYGYDTNGRLSWELSIEWVNNLSYAGYDDWRLPSAQNQDGSGPCGPNFNCMDSEMGHLYLTELKNKGYLAPDGTYQPDWGLKNNGPFSNIYSYFYWSSTESVNPEFAWYFDWRNGEQSQLYKRDGFNIWPVRDGDVASVPEPATFLLVGIGFVSLVGFKYIRQAC